MLVTALPDDLEKSSWRERTSIWESDWRRRRSQAGSFCARIAGKRIDGRIGVC